MIQFGKRCLTADETLRLQEGQDHNGMAHPPSHRSNTTEPREGGCSLAGHIRLLQCGSDGRMQRIRSVPGSSLRRYAWWRRVRGADKTRLATALGVVDGCLLDESGSHFCFLDIIEMMEAKTA